MDKQSYRLGYDPEVSEDMDGGWYESDLIEDFWEFKAKDRQ